MFKKLLAAAALGGLMMTSGCSTTDLMKSAADMFGNDALVSSLTSGLGLSAGQAAGGLGSMMSLAKNTLRTSDFLSLAGYLPNASEYLKFAQDAGVLSGPLTDVAGLNSTMDSLGISPATAQDMYKQVGQFIGDAGGSAERSMLMGLLK